LIFKPHCKISENNLSEHESVAKQLKMLTYYLYALFSRPFPFVLLPGAIIFSEIASTNWFGSIIDYSLIS